ncbi:MAG: protein-tyrosine-phosphatase [Planctomycetota bacterium]
MIRQVLLPLSLMTVFSGCSDANGAASKAEKPRLLPALQRFAESLPAAFDAIPAEHKTELDKLAQFLRTRTASGQPARVIFICTHNSRRSHMGQMAATLAAAHYGLEGIEAYSGGTEVTAFNQRAVDALRRIGFDIDTPSGMNPHYSVRFAEDRDPVEAFSKKYDDPTNPREGFAAVMTCGHADSSCPTVAGAALRIPLHFVDPKAADDTPEEAKAYDERLRQIATEVFYAFSKVRT